MTGDPENTVQIGTNQQVLDRIDLRGISGYGHHGVFDFEREQGQRFVVDVTCWLDLSAAAASDDLADTLDYGALTQAVVADIEGKPVNLIEALALRVARTCLASARVERVQITVHKPDAPIDLAGAAAPGERNGRRNAEVADVAVTLTRSRTRD
ncbi:dihydroneopterin aldolase [Microlunatus elymi]|uniref:7,8-dihydroneopterin aldolase n=1 Tax=Microlunatus elymi TaxID=2596828 RepID=A0A516PVK8_9ACTN|nr:dihydroneopterin aldolase [Microlunatus elymi]QDP95199.1 dihydroneopterin aldolase [Microlunatus elymi]